MSKSNNLDLFDYDVVLQLQKGIIAKKEFNNKFNLLVQTGRFFDNELLSEQLPAETVLQLRLHQEKIDWWTLTIPKHYSLKRVMGILSKFLEDQKLRYIKE